MISKWAATKGKARKYDVLSTHMAQLKRNGVHELLKGDGKRESD